MPTLGIVAQTNQAETDILDLVDSFVPLLPHMAEIVETWVQNLTPAATTASTITALQGPLTANDVLFARYKDFLRTRFNIDLEVTAFASLTEPQRRLVLNASDAYLGVLLNLALFAKIRTTHTN